MKSNPKSNNSSDCRASIAYEFQLISRDRSWLFEASDSDDRNSWVLLIEQAIATRLQSSSLGRGGQSKGGDSLRSLPESTTADASVSRLMQRITLAAGNEFCADCGSPDPDWASLNLGTLVCIGCSGIHRQLGTHISRIRSLRLDEWSIEHIGVMCAIGNTLANSVWEAACPASSRKKPNAKSSMEEKEGWIRAKYQAHEFLPPLPYPDAPLQQQLIDAIARQDTRQVILCLALATPVTVNAPYSCQDPRAALHIAATLGNLVYIQLLLWYNGNLEVTDQEGRNAFYYAHCSQKLECANFLLRSGCSKQLSPAVSNQPTNSSSEPDPRSGQLRHLSHLQHKPIVALPKSHSSAASTATTHSSAIGSTLPRRRAPAIPPTSLHALNLADQSNYHPAFYAQNGTTADEEVGL